MKHVIAATQKRLETTAGIQVELDSSDIRNVDELLSKLSITTKVFKAVAKDPKVWRGSIQDSKPMYKQLRELRDAVDLLEKSFDDMHDD